MLDSLGTPGILPPSSPSALHSESYVKGIDRLAVVY